MSIEFFFNAIITRSINIIKVDIGCFHFCLIKLITKNRKAIIPINIAKCFITKPT